MFPVTWDPTQVAKKKRKTFLEQTEEAAEAALPPVQFQSNLHQTILRRLNNDVPYSGPSSELKLDHILSRVPYKSMLENLFQNVVSQEEVETPSIPILTRAYEESFMRQPTHGERPCVMGDLCECTQIDKTCPFVGTELRLPNDPETPQMCVLCSRSTTQKCFYDMCYLGQPVTAVIQRYGSIYGQPGEYAAEVMLIPSRAIGPVSMPIPSVSHQRNRYTVVNLGGVKHLKQQRVGFEDFHHPSSTGAAC
jgi:hypothetical protein